MLGFYTFLEERQRPFLNISEIRTERSVSLNIQNGQKAAKSEENVICRNPESALELL